MQKQEVENAINEVKQQLRDPVNKNNYVKTKEMLTKLAQLKVDLRSFNLVDNVETYKKNNPEENVIIKKVTVEEDFTKKNIDTYRYHSLLKRLNDKFIQDNCKFKIGELVKSGDKQGIIASFEVYQDQVKRKNTGIYAKLWQQKNDGSAARKMLRRSRLDDMGFPIEELEYVK